MPTRRAAAAAAAAPAAPATLPLDGCKIALSGRFHDFGHNTQSSLEKLVEQLGGSVTRSVSKDTTHVCCTEEDYKRNSAKVTAGKAKDLPLVSPQWILSVEFTGVRADEATFSWATQLAPNGTNGTTASGKKRPIAVAKSADDEEPDSKKAKGGKGTGDKANGMKTNGASKDEAAKEEKQVAEGQFMKKKNAAIPLDELCPLTTYQVYVEPDSGMIWDASLNQSNSGKNNNKFYRIQVCLLFHPFSFQLIQI